MRMMRMIGFYHPFPISPPKWQLCRARVRLYCFLSCYWQNQQHMTVLEDQLIFETKMIMMMMLLENQLETVKGSLFFSTWFCYLSLILYSHIKEVIIIIGLCAQQKLIIPSLQDVLVRAKEKQMQRKKKSRSGFYTKVSLTKGWPTSHGHWTALDKFK